jgi:hypothetical protein
MSPRDVIGQSLTSGDLVVRSARGVVEHKDRHVERENALGGGALIGIRTRGSRRMEGA